MARRPLQIQSLAHLVSLGGWVGVYDAIAEGLSDGAAMTQWTDRAGTKHLLGTATYRSTGGPGGTTPAVEFNGTTDFMDAAAIVTTANRPLQLWAVIDTLSIGAGVEARIVAPSAGDLCALTHYQGDSRRYFYPRTYAGGTGEVKSPSAVGTGVWQLVQCARRGFKGSSVTGKTAGVVMPNSAGGSAGAAVADCAAASGALRVAKDGAVFWNGRLAFLALRQGVDIDSDLSSAVEAFLSARYAGIAGSALPTRSAVSGRVSAASRNPNPIGWWNGDNVVLDGSSRVQQVTDISGNGRHLTQSTASRRPTVGAALNGHGTLGMDPTTERQFLSSGNVAAFRITGPYTLITVARASANKAISFLAGTASTGFDGYGTWFANLVEQAAQAPGDGVTGTTTNDPSFGAEVLNTWVIHVVRFDGVTQNLIRGGSVAMAYATNPKKIRGAITYAGTEEFAVGNWQTQVTDNRCWQGEWAETLIFNQDIGDSGARRWIQQLATKYALANGAANGRVAA